MSNIESNLKTFTFEELKDIIRNNNKVNAINGWSKYKNKTELIKFLIANHKDKFKTLKDKASYTTYFNTITTDEAYKKFQEQFKTLDELNKYIVGFLIPKKRNIKSERAFLLNNFIKKGVKLPDNANEETKKLYKKELEKFKKQSDKQYEKIKNVNFQ